MRQEFFETFIIPPHYPSIRLGPTRVYLSSLQETQSPRRPVTSTSSHLDVQSPRRPVTSTSSHLDVQSQIDHTLADDTSDRLRHRRQYRHTPIIPRRKALLPSVPPSQPLDRPLAARLTTPPPVFVPSDPTVPLQYRISAPPIPSFARRDPIDLLAIVGSKVSAVIKRLQAIFDRKDQLLDILHDHRLALQRIGDRLEWILDNIENGSSWTRSQQLSRRLGA
ncbi:hypothetical protein DICSQDRAFT_173842 [Dichomitus squalens LYAD-421 SS1]|uniref:Uncharacterized protein n=1 Tax=Dichomitus squalens (strain LYAD-421) TaxID=732165 RepID=R7SMU1_DICSQ|nr:uncharacterized protein DICSQDRAFT_173842 [Dichomitus squalens LYAD-421 SS1]EJF57504.1 hypothetical protein DICSQDRAFT_173842 [Dichomitus squalens LYAD-421 SS1]